MRIDKYLKVARIIKRREVANAIISSGSVLLNGRVAKPANLVKIDDIIVLTTLKKELTIKVKEIRQNSTVENAKNMFEILREVSL